MCRFGPAAREMRLIQRHTLTASKKGEKRKMRKGGKKRIILISKTKEGKSNEGRREGGKGGDYDHYYKLERVPHNKENRKDSRR